MRKLLAALFVPLLVLAAPWAAAQDQNLNGLEDSSEGAVLPPVHEDGPVAIVDTGSSSINDYQSRLNAAGYAHVLIPVNSDYATLSQYDAVIMPVSHAATATYGIFDALATDYHQYVNDGGCLYIGQPNPFDHSGSIATITWAPYMLTDYAFYDSSDCPVIIEDPTHCMTQGLIPDDLPFPADQVISYGPEWQILVTGPITGFPGLMTAPYGAGQVLVELGHPATGAICAYTNAGFAQWFACCLGPPVPAEDTSWGRVKSMFR